MYLGSILVFSINLPFSKSYNGLGSDFRILLGQDKGTVVSSSVSLLVKLSVHNNEKLTLMVSKTNKAFQSKKSGDLQDCRSSSSICVSASSTHCCCCAGVDEVTKWGCFREPQSERLLCFLSGGTAVPTPHITSILFLLLLLRDFILDLSALRFVSFMTH